MPDGDPLDPNIAEEFDPFATVQPDVVSGADEAAPFVPTFGTAGLNFAPGTQPDVVSGADQAFVPTFGAPGLEQLAPFSPFAGAVSPGPGPAPTTTAPTEDEELLPPYPQVPEDTLAPDVRSSSLAYRNLGQQKSALTSQIGNLDAQIAVEKDPTKRAQLIAQRKELGQTLNLVSAGQKEAGQRVDAGIAEAQETALAAKADAELAMAENIAEQSQAVRDRANAEMLNLKAQQGEAMARLNEDREKYRALMSRGPKQQAVASTLASITSEVFRAALENRVADFSAIAEQAWQRNRQAFADERDAAQTNIKLSGDRVRDIAVARDAVIAEEAAQKAAVLEQAAQQAQLQIQRAKTPLEKETASLVYMEVQKEAEKKAAEAAQARLNALQKEEARQLKNAETRAKIAKTRADIEKTQAEAAKLRRRGLGGKKKPEIVPEGVRAPNEVVLPGTNRTIATFPDTADGYKRADKAQKWATANSEMMRRGHEYAAAISKAGKRGAFDKENWLDTPEGKRLQSMRANLAAPLAVQQAGGGVPSDGERKAAEGLIPGPDSIWKRQTSGTADAALKWLLDEMSKSARATVSEAGLKVEAAQEIIDNNRAISSGPRRAAEKARTPEGVAQKAIEETGGTEPGERGSAGGRIGAVDQLKAQAKRDANREHGDEQLWVLSVAQNVEPVLKELYKNPGKKANAAAIRQIENLVDDALVKINRAMPAARLQGAGSSDGRRKLQKLRIQRDTLEDLRDRTKAEWMGETTGGYKVSVSDWERDKATLEKQLETENDPSRRKELQAQLASVNKRIASVNKRIESAK